MLRYVILLNYVNSNCIMTGILAGMWPYGIVVFLQELFTAESKSQVYAALHELLSNCPSISNSLSKCSYIVYSRDTSSVTSLFLFRIHLLR